MMRYLLLALLILPGAARVHAQGEVVADTLDWRQYYPLEVGNAWEWETTILVAYHGLDRRAIVGDTLMGGQRYFVQAAYAVAVDPVQGLNEAVTDTVYLRYDTLRTRVVALARDGTAEQDYTCDLSAAFGTVAPCDLMGEMHVGGGYAWDDGRLVVGGDTLHVPAVKHLYNVGGGVSYYHGVGMLPGIGDGAVGGTGFLYVRVGGQEYGERVVFVHTESPPPAVPPHLHLYPNPSPDALTVALAGYGGRATVTLYDLLGRVIASSRSCPEPRCTLSVTGLAAGRYLVRVVGRNNRVTAQGITVVR